MSTHIIPPWKKAPFIRIFFFLVPGILIQFYLPQKPQVIWGALLFATTCLIFFFFISSFARFHLLIFSGLSIGILFISLGALLVLKQDIGNDPGWIGATYKASDAVIITLDEPPVEKTRSFKASCTVSSLLRNGKLIPAKGRIILYFEQDSLLSVPTYGDRLITRKPLQAIRSSGNPGAFDYKRFCIFQDISHQLFLQSNDFVLLPGKNENWLYRFLYSTRKHVLAILRKNINDKKQAGLAEALLIGYKNDLDKTLVQSYTNTGVVHIIAISGLHLGLIYWLLVRIVKPLQRKIKLRWLPPLLVITGLWLFSLLAGAQPSVLRSAIMFSCIALAEGLSRKTSIYNSLAFSAMALLCYNPYWLWDAGFQLSYAAVLSIVMFNQSLYNLFYFKNRFVDILWKMNTVTLAAQVLTIPVSIYHFHQFPNYFLFTNFIAVPLSSLVLIAEIVLCCVAFLPFVAAIIGKLIGWLIWLMNWYVERIELLPFALADRLEINVLQAAILTIFFAAFAFWIVGHSVTGFKTGLIAFVIFLSVRSVSFIKAARQQKIVVYNIPQHQAIDIMDGRNVYFIGDSGLAADQYAQNFHLRPSRTQSRAGKVIIPFSLKKGVNYLSYRSCKIMLINETSRFSRAQDIQPIDLLIISKNPKLYLNTLLQTFRPGQVVFDGSVPYWKLGYWKKDCDSLKIPWHDVSLQGAFVMKLN